MNTLAAQRTSLGDALRSIVDLTVLDHLPERIPTPSALIAAGSPYVAEGDAYGSFTLRFTVVLVCGAGTNDATTTALDALVSSALVALDGAGWAVEQVDQPTMLSANNTNYLSTTIDVRRVVDTVDDGSP